MYVSVEESTYQQQTEVNSKAVKELTDVKNGLECIEQNTRLACKNFYLSFRSIPIVVSKTIPELQSDINFSRILCMRCFIFTEITMK